MSFESLAFRLEVNLESFPESWLPLIHLYDPDLPQFPLYYFHVLANDLPKGSRASVKDRAYGYVERISYINGDLIATIVTNKDLVNDPNNKRRFYSNVIDEVRERFGYNNVVSLKDIEKTFDNHLFPSRNDFIKELWNRVVTNYYDNRLPFGRLWDGVFGLNRCVASWYSQNGRKSEFIQTHYFSSKFGEKIQLQSGLPKIDFYLLPTYDELCDSSNPLSLFPKYESLITVIDSFYAEYCTNKIKLNNKKLISTTTSSLVTKISSTAAEISLSQLTLPSIYKSKNGINTKTYLKMIDDLKISVSEKNLALECFNAFGKGPRRTIIFFLILHDLRYGLLHPENLNNSDFEIIYTSLKSTYNSPKVISMYAQQCFGNENALPIDTWVETFLHSPLYLYNKKKLGKEDYSNIFNNTTKLGKFERLIWFASQARKVHSSACDDCLWCTKYGSPEKNKKNNNERIRGANPLSCTICIKTIRDKCPAFNDIKDYNVSFNLSNLALYPNINFNIITNGTTFVEVFGQIDNISLRDSFSPKDAPQNFQPYHHVSNVISVKEFIDSYKR